MNNTYADLMSKSPLLSELRGRLRLFDTVAYEGGKYTVVIVGHHSNGQAFYDISNGIKNVIFVRPTNIVPLPSIGDWLELLGNHVRAMRILPMHDDKPKWFVDLTELVPLSQGYYRLDEALCVAYHWLQGYKWDGEWKKL